MILFKSYWRKLIGRLIAQTPGVGCPDEATRAVNRSEAAIRDAQRVHGIVAGNADFLVEVKKRNHFRDHVTEALTLRRSP